MNLRHLSFVLCVAEHESFSAAASVCNVTQPTLSAGVSQVETRLGARLFERNTRSVALTAFGREILPAIHDVIASEKALAARARTLVKPNLKLVRVGVSPIVEIARAVALMKPYRDRHPGIDFVYKECFVDDLEARLAANTIDLAIWPATATAGPALSSAPLYRDPWVFLPNAAVPERAGGLPRRMSEIAGQPLILTSGYCGLSQATRTMFEQSRLELSLYPGRAISYGAIEEWADLGLGAALLPASKVSRGRKGAVVPVLNEDRTAAMLDIVVSWRPAAQAPAHLRDLLAFIQASTAQPSGAAIG